MKDYVNKTAPAVHTKHIVCTDIFAKENCQPHEEVLLFIRKHWVIEWAHILTGIFFIVAPFVALLFIYDYLGNWQLVATSVALWIIMFSVLYVYVQWLDFYLDVMIVTNRKIIDIDQNGFFDRSSIETSLLKVQDVKWEIHSMLGTFLKFGSIMIQTAGESSQGFGMDYIAHPEETAHIIRNIQEKCEEEARRGSIASEEI